MTAPETTKMKTAKQILDELVATTTVSMKEQGIIPPRELIGWSFEGEAVWSVFPRPNDGTQSDHAVSVLEAIQMFCFSPAATFISYFYSLDTDNEGEKAACALVADVERMTGYFGNIKMGEDGKFHSMEENHSVESSLKKFDGELFGAFSGIMQYSAAPIKDIEPLVNVLRQRGHEVTILAKR